VGDVTLVHALFLGWYRIYSVGVGVDFALVQGADFEQDGRQSLFVLKVKRVGLIVCIKRAMARYHRKQTSIHHSMAIHR